MPGQPCSICTHPERQQIEALIIAGKSLRDIAGQFGTSKSAVDRHKENCMPAVVQIAKQEQQVAAGLSVLDRLAQGEQVVDKVLEPLLKDGVTPDMPLDKALALHLKQVELRAKIEGELDERSITVTAIPDWHDLRALLLDALAHHPQARIDVLRALEAYDANKSA